MVTPRRAAGFPPPAGGCPTRNSTTAIMILADHHRRAVGCPQRSMCTTSRRRALPAPMAKGCRQQKAARHSHRSRTFQRCASPAQSHQQQTDKGCIVCVKYSPAPGFVLIPHHISGSAGRSGLPQRRPAADTAARPPGQSPHKAIPRPRSIMGLTIKHCRAGRHCINATLSPRSSTRKGSCPKHRPPMHTVSVQAAADMSQDALQYRGAFSSGSRALQSACR